ncbi:hypothetical protein MtrunA17_Chr8g0347951 [Medicago truncatula]|uniref:Transmembrane protein, putative n=1 Tax=Medicago truncatula TaxID=3880 RepID=A0A072TNH4_MEDTR|nr:transmembrane protein, putative [Medicago truncatula]RHN39810.1 hypothetical protein MtrunA17_Chr8g0347951 [Medicago truncatula]
MGDVVSPRSNFLRGHEVTINVVGSVHVKNIMGVETNPQHGLVAFIFFVLLGFLQVRYPENPTPFQVHPKTTLVSIASFLLYCLAFMIKLKFATRVDTLLEVFGSLSLISLVLMLLPENWGLFGYIIIYTIWFIFHVLIMIRLYFIGLSSKVRRLRPLLPNTLTDLDQWGHV